MEDYDEEGVFYTGEPVYLSHADSSDSKKEEQDKEDDKSNNEESEDNNVADNTNSKSKSKTIQDVIDTMTKEQQDVMYALIGSVMEEADSSNNDEDEDEEDKDKSMKHNFFSDGAVNNNDYLSHSDMQKIIEDGKRIGSLREAVNQNLDGGVLVHAEIPTDGMVTPTPGDEEYGFKSPSMFYPDAKPISNTPEFIGRRTEWVQSVLSSVNHTPFSRVKSMYANITEEEARARGYIKGKRKTYEVFSTLKRVTNPTTIYKLQKMDRDDIIDITDFNVVDWIKGEMKEMLNEEIARAILIGDGRLQGTDEKISEECIRPVANDVDLFNVKVEVSLSDAANNAEKASRIIDAIIRAHKSYKGSGNPTLYTTDDWLTEMLLLEDKIGHKLYKTTEELATTLRVSKIVTVEAMEGYKVNESQDDLIGVVVNLRDYNVGQNPNGGVSMFDDFDIDFNQQKYLIETRMSGALTKPFSALTIIGKNQD